MALSCVPGGKLLEAVGSKAMLEMLLLGNPQRWEGANVDCPGLGSTWQASHLHQLCLVALGTGAPSRLALLLALSSHSAFEVHGVSLVAFACMRCWSMWLTGSGYLSTSALMNSKLRSALCDTEIYMKMEYPLDLESEEVEQERFCLTAHSRSCWRPEQLGIPIPALLQLAEKLVGSVLGVLFTCWFVWWGFFLSRCVGMYVSAFCMKKSLGKLNKTMRSALLLSSFCCISLMQFDSHLPPPLL